MSDTTDTPAGDVPVPFRRARAAAPEQSAPPAAPPERMRATYAVTLDRHFADWLDARAAAHGQEPAEHAAAILRLYWANHDTWRHQQAPGMARPVGA